MYNKIKIFFVAFCAIILLEGCYWSKDYCSTCTSTKVVFKYFDDQSVGGLDKHVHSALLFVYDSQKNLVATQEVLAKDIRSTKGVLLDLPLGELYTIVCWANVDRNNTSIEGYDRLDLATVASIGYNNTLLDVASNDALYFGSNTFIFPDADTTIKRIVPIELSPASVTVNITVRGLKLGGLKSVGFKGHLPKFNFNKEIVFLREQKITPKIEYNTLTKNYITSFSFLRPNSLVNTFIDVMPADLNLYVENIDLNAYLSKIYNKIDLTKKQEIIIDLLVDYTGSDVAVSVEVPNWSEIDTGGSIS